MSTWWPPDTPHGDYLVTTWWSLFDHLVTTSWLLGDPLVTNWWPIGDHLVTTWWPLDNHMVTTWRPHGDHMVILFLYITKHSMTACGANLCHVGSISPFLRVDLQIQDSQYHKENPIRLFWGKNTSPWRLLHQFEVSSPPRQSGDGAAMGPNYCTFTVMRRRKRWDKEDLLVVRTL